MACSPGEQSTCKPDGVDDRPGEARPGEALGLAIEEAEIEARVVCDQHRVTCELEKPPHGDRRMRLAAQLAVAQSGQRADRGADRHTRGDQQLELVWGVALPQG